LSLPEMVAELARESAVVNAARARQMVLVAAIVRTETVECEDGTLVHLPGAGVQRRLDAAALVAGVLGVSQWAAQGWVSRAEQLTGPLAPVLDAMAEGVLDESRVKVICDELIDVDDVVAAQVARELVPQVRAGLVEDPCGEAGVRLKRRVRTVLAGVDPDAVRERAEKTRMERCLRRWATEAGREAWFAQLPADQSMRAWAAIDALARQFVAEGRCDTLDEACADALIALLEGQATVTYQVSLGIPTPGSLTDEDTDTAEQTPGQSASPAAEDVVAATLAALGRHGDTEVEVTGGGNPQPSEVRADWVAAVLAKAVRDGRVRVYAVHPDTGALLDPDDDLATAAYVPGEALKEVVRARDGRCRFPGCTVNVRFCDLDHVRPWPTGPTAASNLMVLCRRHHRIKQMVGWQVSLQPDATVLWVDPLGRRSVTRPLDHRGRAQTPPSPRPPSHVDEAVRAQERDRELERRAPFSALHTVLETQTRHALARACRARTTIEGHHRGPAQGPPRGDTPWQVDLTWHTPSHATRIGTVTGTGMGDVLIEHGPLARPSYDEPPF
jgi:hypothetical protein